jgi:oxidoreductase
MSRTALFVGASGLIGRQAIKDVLRTGNYTKIISIGRRISEFEDDIPQENLVKRSLKLDI